MVIKKIPPKVALILSFEEHHRVVKVVELLAAVALRIDASKKNFAGKRKASGQKIKKVNKVRKFREPCFFNQTLYHVTVDLAASLDTIYFAANCYINHSQTSPFVATPGTAGREDLFIYRDYHDRHHSFNIHKQHVSHYRT